MLKAAAEKADQLADIATEMKYTAGRQIEKAEGMDLETAKPLICEMLRCSEVYGQFKTLASNINSLRNNL